MPDLEGGQHLLDYLEKEIGFCLPGASGPVAIPFTEIDSWSRLTQTQLSPGEALALRRLSRAWVDMFHEAKSPDCPMPWRPVVFDREAVSRGVASTLRRIAKRQQRNRKRK